MYKQEDFRNNRNVSNYYCGTYLRIKNSCSSHKIKTSVLENLVLEAIQIQVKLVIELEKSLLKLDLISSKKKLDDDYKKFVKENDLKIERLKNEKREAYEKWKFEEITKEEFTNINNTIENKINSIMEENELYKINYLEKIKKVKKNDYWIGHYKRNKKISKVTKQVLDDLIESIEVYEGGKIKINFKYYDEYESIMTYLESKEGEKECLYGGLQYI